MICPNCKKENTGELPYCVYCGYEFGTQEEHTAKENTPEHTHSQPEKESLQEVEKKTSPEQGTVPQDQEKQRKKPMETRKIVIILSVVTCVSVAALILAVSFIAGHQWISPQLMLKPSQSPQVQESAAPSPTASPEVTEDPTEKPTVTPSPTPRATTPPPDKTKAPIYAPGVIEESDKLNRVELTNVAHYVSGTVKPLYMKYSDMKDAIVPMVYRQNVKEYEYNGKRICVVYPYGAYDVQYTREYYYDDNGNLIYAYIEGQKDTAGRYKIYFYENTPVRYINKSNVTYDNDFNNKEYMSWASFAIEEAYADLTSDERLNRD